MYRAAAVAATIMCALAVVSTAAADPARVGPPNSMASTGDSITRAFNTCWFPFIDCVANSWSTGTSATVNSHYRRILAGNSLISGRNFNDAVTGAEMTDLNGEAQKAVTQNVEYVTILMGANDVCASSESAMTPVATYRAQFAQAMATLSSGLPSARIFVVSIPDIYNLWAILKDSASARLVWSLYGICQSMLARPLSTTQGDVDRRNRVRQRNIQFNIQLREVCALYIHCRYDNDAAFNTQFTRSDVSTRDYFHPSVSGQTKASSVTWAATFNFADSNPPVSTPSIAAVEGGMSVTLTATDDAGIAGIEYRLGPAAWTRYVAGITVSTGTTLTWRAVDVNGNIEATKTLTG